MPMRFLTARWSNLALLNFVVPEPLFRPYLPPGCVPDTSLDGQAYGSLVGFDFLDTRVLGVRWPGYVNFPEFNLRLYIRHEPSGDRGVVFVREIVPSRLIAAIARWTYNEPYLALPLASRTEQRAQSFSVEHTLTHDGRTSRMKVLARTPAETPPKDAWQTWFKEHRWGFNRSRTGRLIRYEVVHPAWACYPTEAYELDWDFEGLYGPPWGLLATQRPASVLLATGSDVSVYVWRSQRA